MLSIWKCCCVVAFHNDDVVVSHIGKVESERSVAVCIAVVVQYMGRNVEGNYVLY